MREGEREEVKIRPVMKHMLLSHEHLQRMLSHDAHSIVHYDDCKRRHRHQMKHTYDDGFSRGRGKQPEYLQYRQRDQQHGHTDQVATDANSIPT